MAEITPPETALFAGVIGDPIEGLSVDDKGPTHLLPPEEAGTVGNRENPPLPRGVP
jgi:hypothetical protein